MFTEKSANINVLRTGYTILILWILLGGHCSVLLCQTSQQQFLSPLVSTYFPFSSTWMAKKVNDINYIKWYLDHFRCRRLPPSHGSPPRSQAKKSTFGFGMQYQNLWLWSQQYHERWSFSQNKLWNPRFCSSWGNVFGLEIGRSIRATLCSIPLVSYYTNG